MHHSFKSYGKYKQVELQVKIILVFLAHIFTFCRDLYLFLQNLLIFWCSFIVTRSTPSSISHWRGLVIISSLSFCLSGNVLVLPHFWRTVLTDGVFLVDSFFFFSFGTLNVLTEWVFNLSQHLFCLPKIKIILYTLLLVKQYFGHLFWYFKIIAGAIHTFRRGNRGSELWLAPGHTANVEEEIGTWVGSSLGLLPTAHHAPLPQRTHIV